jgi:hypothetical protein
LIRKRNPTRNAENETHPVYLNKPIGLALAANKANTPIATIKYLLRKVLALESSKLIWRGFNKYSFSWMLNVSVIKAIMGYGIDIFTGEGTDGAWDRIVYPARFSKNGMTQDVVCDHLFPAVQLNTET